MSDETETDLKPKPIRTPGGVACRAWNKFMEDLAKALDLPSRANTAGRWVWATL